MEDVAIHKSNGFKFVVAKCAAHGRDDKQAEHINVGNKLADTAAKAANRERATSPVCSSTTPSPTAYSSADAQSEVTHVVT